jgi:Domain of unknown function (DUF4349)
MRREMHPIKPEELMAYLDGELALGQVSEAAGHLLRCGECRTAAADLQSVSRRLLEWQVEEPGPRVEIAVNSTRVPERTRPAWRRGVPWIIGLTAACIVVMTFVTVTSVTEPRQKRTVSALVDPRLPASEGRTPQGRTFSADMVRTRDPLVVRTAQITLTTPDFAKARAALDSILKRHGGHIGVLTVGSPADSGQTLQATLRIPTAQLDAALSEIRDLGRIETEQQGGEEVTQQVVDVEARLSNARNTEQRLLDLLRRHTGKITDVLAVEKEMDRVRGEIEQMEAERKRLGDRVSFSTLEVVIHEEYKAHLAVAAPSTFSRLRNAAVEGYRNAAGSVTEMATLLLSYGPAFVLWAAFLFVPVRFMWRRLRKSGQ